MFEHETEQLDQAQREEKLRNSYRALFESEDGRRVLSHLVQFTDIFRTAFEVGDDLKRHDGRREVGLMILRNSGKLALMREIMGV